MAASLTVRKSATTDSLSFFLRPRSLLPSFSHVALFSWLLPGSLSLHQRESVRTQLRRGTRPFLAGQVLLGETREPVSPVQGWTTRPISDRGQSNKVSLTELYWLQSSIQVSGKIERALCFSTFYFRTRGLQAALGPDFSLSWVKGSCALGLHPRKERTASFSCLRNQLPALPPLPPRPNADHSALWWKCRAIAL